MPHPDMQKTHIKRSSYKYIILAATIIAALAGSMLYSKCQPKQHIPTKAELDSIARIDSAALHVALITNEDCLPLFYAKEAGLIDTTRLDVRLLAFDGRLDCDTASINGHAEVCYVDVARAILMRKDSTYVHIFASLPSRQTLIVTKKKNISNLTSLKQRIVGLERHSASDYYSDMLLDSVKLQQEDIYRPQINSLYTRYTMVSNDQFEVAFLEEPYTSMALKARHKKLWQAPKNGPQFAALAINESALASPERIEQTQLLVKAYDKAVEHLTTEPDTIALKRVLTNIYKLSEKEIEAAKTMRPTRLGGIDYNAIKTMRTWLIKRGRIKENFTTDGLTTDKIKNK